MHDPFLGQTIKNHLDFVQTMSQLLYCRSNPTSQLVPKMRDWSMSGNEKFRVVAVDDNNDILDLIRMSLGDTYEVITTNDPLQAAELLDLVEPEIVILDIMMPKVTGYQIAETIRRTPKLAHTLIMFLSAKDSPRDVKYGYKLGANFYITKPFQPDRLLRTVDALLREHYPSNLAKPKSLPIAQVRAKIQAKLAPINPWQAHQNQQLLGAPPKPDGTSARPGPAASSSSRLPKAGTPPSGTQPAAPSIVPPDDPDGEGSGIGRRNWVG
jgi:CheY-like chemotaxis protein